MPKHVYSWVDDSDVEACPPCPECGAETKALMIEPDRSVVYLRDIFLCTRKGCQMAWPRVGARHLKGIN